MLYWRCGVVALLLVASWFLWRVRSSAQPAPVPPQEPAKAETARRFPVQIRTPKEPPRIQTAQLDAQGQPALVRCATCHAVTTTKTATRAAEELKTFHQGLHYRHGNLSCVSCHHAEDYDSLRGADNRKIPFAQVMELCSQCHGSQARDYAHGAHGGMTGYWDLTKGPRQRNNCIHCHDPHHPAYPRVQPVFAPKDRFPPVAPAGEHE